ncbi:ATP-binding protein [Saccharopolyspora taberi]|uniref:Tetratricopeptide repeat protein n=1 Tax=Saccharopolyspora taberi TaxID=60895 RepID=A0ABN3VH08_9PSEU
MSEDSRNDLSGSARDFVQAREVSGGVHFHGREPVAGPPPRQLPGDVRGFVNRAQELERLDLILADRGRGRNAIATCVVVGTAGVGKTSLAVHWAHQVADRFPDGQLYVNLHGYDPGAPITADQALERFLLAMGVPADAVPADLESRAALYRSRLAGRRVLVVLDNAATAGQVRPLLPGVAGCLVLVTSRSRLSGLVARDGAYRVTLGVLHDSEAVELLRGATEGYRLPDEVSELTELARLCARLPLALRIAAERAISRPHMPLHDLIAELRDESALWEALTAGDDDESDAVRTVFAWSYRALPAEAGRLFRLLGLHPGAAFSSTAAAALADLPAARTRRLLDDLVGAHLLEQPQPNRYEFHDLLRAYATNQARAEETAETTDAAVRRVLLWYLRTAEEAVQVLNGSESPMFAGYQQANDWYEQERPNLVAATRVAEETGMRDLAARIPAVLRGIYANRNHFDDWFATATLALGAVRGLGDRAGEADVLESLGKAHTQSSNPAEAIRFQQAALAIRAELGDTAGEIGPTNAIGLTHLRTRALPEAREWFERAAEIAAELDDEYWTATAWNNAANVDLELERFAEAAERLRQALAVFRRLGARDRVGDALRGLSHAHRGLGELDAASTAIEEAVVIAEEIQNRAREAFWLLERGRVQLALGEPHNALDSLQRAAMLQRRLGDRAREAMTFDATGEAYQQAGQPAEAIGFHRLAVTAFRELGDRWQLALALDHLGAALHATGAADDADSCREEAAGLFAAFPDPRATRLRARR